MKNYLILEAVKRIMVQMAIDGNFPLDLNDLDIHSIHSKAESNLENNEQFKRVCKLEKLGEFVSAEDDEDKINMLNILEKHEDPNEITGWIDGITMCERFETSFSVKQLLQEIS